MFAAGLLELLKPTRILTSLIATIIKILSIQTRSSNSGMWRPPLGVIFSVEFMSEVNKAPNPSPRVEIWGKKTFLYLCDFSCFATTPLCFSEMFLGGLRGHFWRIVGEVLGTCLGGCWWVAERFLDSVREGL